jgi:hypothetical protein
VADRHALGPAGRPRGVEDVGQVVGVRGTCMASRSPEVISDQLITCPDEAAVAPGVASITRRGSPTSHPRAVATRRPVGHHRRGPGVRQHVGHLGRGQTGIHGHGDAAGPVDAAV